MPSCPVEDDVRRWVEARMAWLAREFGDDRLRTATVVLPTTEFFPAEWHGTEEEARALGERVAGFMGLDFNQIEIHEFNDPEAPEGMRTQARAGTYYEADGIYYVGYDASGLDEPLQLAATFAHEFAHIHLLGHRRISGDEPDHELLTDLTALFLGMGVLAANANVYEKNLREGHVENWRIGRVGYLDLRTFGYAFAVFAHLRREENPPWEKFLRPDVRSAMRKGRAWLTAEGFGAANESSNFAVPESLRDRLPNEQRSARRSASGKRRVAGVRKCSYCNTVVSAKTQDDEAPICRACRRSIDDNEGDRASATGRLRQAARIWDWALIAGLLGALAFGIVSVLSSFF